MSRRNKRRRNRDGLKSKVAEVPTFQDEKGEFILYCNFNCHPGAVLKYEVCEHRHCQHLRRAYLDEKVYPREFGRKC